MTSKYDRRLILLSENDEGVHLMSALNAEYSLCGDATDAGSSGDNPAGDLLDTLQNKVTCPKCLIEMQNCKEALYPKKKDQK